MPTHIKIIHSHEFIKATAQGVLDFAKTRKLLLEVVSVIAASPLEDYEIILDTRKTQSYMSVVNIYDLVSELRKHHKSFSGKIAVLCPADRFNFAEFFATCAVNRGFKVQAFVSFSDAMEWLIVPAEELEKI
jgi:hypothetical protein